MYYIYINKKICKRQALLKLLKGIYFEHKLIYKGIKKPYLIKQRNFTVAF